MAVSEVYTPEDSITPSKVEHRFDEGFDADTQTCLFRYNFLCYEFAHPKGAIRARSYVDTMDHVAIYLPEGVGLEDETVQHVVAYLRRRYPDVQRLTSTGYESIVAK